MHICLSRDVAKKEPENQSAGLLLLGSPVIPRIPSPLLIGSLSLERSGVWGQFVPRQVHVRLPPHFFPVTPNFLGIVEIGC